jgi:hypothetical protein
VCVRALGHTCLETGIGGKGTRSLGPRHVSFLAGRPYQMMVPTKTGDGALMSHRRRQASPHPHPRP